MRGSEINHYFDIKEFISEDTWNEYGPSSFLYVQQRIINSCKLLHQKLSDVYDVPQGDVSVRINTWHFEDGDKVYQYQGYISGKDNEKKYHDGDFGEEDYDSFHRQGHAVNVRVKIKKDGEIKVLNSYEIAAIVLEFEDDFILNGLTVISEPRSDRDYLHMDCRNTRSFKLKIVT